MKDKFCFLIGIFLLLVIVAVRAQEQIQTQNDSLTQEKATSTDTLQQDDTKKKSLLNLVDITESWSIYQPATLDPVNWRPLGPKADTLRSLLRNDIHLFNKNRLDQAIDSLLLMIQIDSLNYNLHNLIGVKYGKIGYLKKAKEYFQRAIFIDSTIYKAINNIGNVFFIEGEFEKAYEQYRKSASLALENADILINWAYAALELGQTEKAIELENRAFELKQTLKLDQRIYVITEFETEIAMKASEGTKSSLEPIWLE